MPVFNPIIIVDPSQPISGDEQNKIFEDLKQDLINECLKYPGDLKKCLDTIILVIKSTWQVKNKEFIEQTYQIAGFENGFYYKLLDKYSNRLKMLWKPVGPARDNLFSGYDLGKLASAEPVKIVKLRHLLTREKIIEHFKIKIKDSIYQYCKQENVTDTDILGAILTIQSIKAVVSSDSINKDLEKSIAALPPGARKVSQFIKQRLMDELRFLAQLESKDIQASAENLAKYSVSTPIQELINWATYDLKPKFSIEILFNTALDESKKAIKSALCTNSGDSIEILLAAILAASKKLDISAENFLNSGLATLGLVLPNSACNLYNSIIDKFAALNRPGISKEIIQQNFTTLHDKLLSWLLQEPLIGGNFYESKRTDYIEWTKHHAFLNGNWLFLPEYCALKLKFKILQHCPENGDINNELRKAATLAILNQQLLISQGSNKTFRNDIDFTLTKEYEQIYKDLTMDHELKILISILCKTGSKIDPNAKFYSDITRRLGEYLSDNADFKLDESKLRTINLTQEAYNLILWLNYELPVKTVPTFPIKTYINSLHLTEETQHLVIPITFRKDKLTLPNDNRGYFILDARAENANSIPFLVKQLNETTMYGLALKYSPPSTILASSKKPLASEQNNYLFGEKKLISNENLDKILRLMQPLV